MGQVSSEPFVTVINQNTFALKGIFEAPYPTGSDAGFITVNLTTEESVADKQNFAKIQQAYNACLDKPAQAQMGLTELTSFLDQVAKLFPLGTSKSDKPTAVGETLAFFAELGIPSLLEIFITPDSLNPDVNMLAITGPILSDFPLESLTEDTLAQYAAIGSSLLVVCHYLSTRLKQTLLPKAEVPR